MFDLQFEVARTAQIVIVMLDHDNVESITPNDFRLERHATFGKQMREYLRNRSFPQRRMHIVLNKRDEWERAEAGQFLFFNSSPPTHCGADYYHGPRLSRARAIRIALTWLYRAGAAVPRALELGQAEDGR